MTEYLKTFSEQILKQIEKLSLPEEIRVRMIETDQLVFNPDFRKFCQENTCGSYGAAYSCPPDAGSPEELIARVKSYPLALVYQIYRAYPGLETPVYQNRSLILEARLAHQEAGDQIQQLLEKYPAAYHAIGSGKCILCQKCARLENQPCRKPDRLRISMSAYCIDVSRMAQTCGLEFGDSIHTLTYFGLFCVRPLND